MIKPLAYFENEKWNSFSKFYLEIRFTNNDVKNLNI